MSAPSGTRVMKLTTSGTAGDYTAARHNTDVPAAAGDIFRLSALIFGSVGFVEGLSPGESVSLGVSWRNAAGNEITSDYTEFLVTTTPTRYNCSTQFAPSGTVAARIYAAKLITLGATVWVDDIWAGKAEEYVNPTREVLIDAGGVHIINGKLDMTDEFGYTQFTGVGFVGGGWQDFIRSHIYNASLSAGIPTVSLPLGRTSSLPYWTISRTGGATASLVADTQWPGGQKVSYAPLALGPTDSITLVTDLFPVIPGRRYNVRAWFNTVIAGGAMEVIVSMSTFLADGFTLDPAFPPYWELIHRQIAPSGNTYPSYETSNVTTFTPTATRYAKLTVTLQEAGTHIAFNRVYFGGLQLVEVPTELDLATTYQAGGVQADTFGVGITGLIPVNITQIQGRVNVAGDLRTSPGVLITKSKTGSPTDDDFEGTPLNGALLVDITNNRLWVRVGTNSWKYAALT